jgi:hypothetical protein
LSWRWSQAQPERSEANPDQPLRTLFDNSLTLELLLQKIERFRHLLCLIIDERSLLTSKLLGTTAQIISETIYDGTQDQIGDATFDKQP